MRERLLQTEEMLAKGYRHSIIVATLRANYPIGVKACEKLITRVYKKWSASGKRHKSRERAAQVNRLKSIFEIKDISIVDRIRTETLLARILGTEAPVKHAGGGVDDEPISLVIKDYRGQSKSGEQP